MSKQTMLADQEKPEKPEKKEDTTARDNAITKQIIDGLGKPQHFDHVAVKSLWGYRVRVNVYTKDATTADTLVIPLLHCVDSFFVTINEDHTIQSCRPSPSKKY